MTEHEGIDLAALRKFLEFKRIGIDGELRAELISGGKSNLTYRILDDSSRWVLRRPPTGGLTPSAHDVAREYRVVDGLHSTGVPVARAVALCEDPSVMGAPFAVVDHVDGRVVRTSKDLESLSDNDVNRCVDELIRVLATLHDVDYRACGLGEFGRPDGYLGRQVRLWAGQWERVKSRDLPDVDRLYAALRVTIPPVSESAIVHGDFRVDNTLLDHGDVGRIAAVVDWELATLGDPLTDVALMCVYRNPALDRVLGEDAAWTSARMPSADDLAQRYSATSGRELAHWNFYLALANFKLAVIAAGIDHRFRAGATIGEGFDHAGDAVPEFVAAGLSAIKGKEHSA